MSGGHLTLDEMRACARGEDEALISIAVEHCKACEECARRLAAALAMTHRDPGRSAYRRACLAGVVAAAILLALAISAYQDTIVFEFEQDAVTRLATNKPPPEFIVRFQLGSRSAVSTGNVHARLVSGALLVARGELEQALGVLRPLRAEAPEAPEVALYLGIARYLSGEDSQHVGELLSRGGNSPNESVGVFARWYLANFFLRNGEVELAEELLDELSLIDELYGREATKLLAEIEEAR